MTSPSRAAARAEHSPAVRVFARVGLASIGILHILVGGLALAVATGGGGNADQAGALQEIVAVPGGLFAVWLVAVGLFVLALWQILQAVTSHGLGNRVTEIAKCVVYALLGVLSISVALGGSRNSSSSEQSMSGRLLAVPGGVFLLAAIGVGIAVTGVVFIRNGVTHRFERDLRLPPNALAGIITVLGRIGYVAKGIALILVGGLVVFGAITYDPSKAGGLDGSLKALMQVPFGVVLLVVIALGLIAYGAFWCIRAVGARL